MPRTRWLIPASLLLAPLLPAGADVRAACATSAGLLEVSVLVARFVGRDTELDARTHRRAVHTPRRLQILHARPAPRVRPLSETRVHTPRSLRFAVLRAQSPPPLLS